MKHATQAKGEPLTEALRMKLRDLVDERGETAAADVLGVSRFTVGRACAGLALYAGTRAIIEQRLAGIEVQP